jgi:uncharacterized protein with HEPN domain
MSETDDRKEVHWLKDMREAVEKIQTHPRFADGKHAFDMDEYYRVWVLFHMERIGECASNLRRDHDYDNKHPDIDWKGTQGMRRKIVHQYWVTDYEKVWNGVQYLPKIKEKVDELLKEKQREAPKQKDNPRPKAEDVFKIKQPEMKKERDRDDDLNR